jgi:hypothetical protein
MYSSYEGRMISCKLAILMPKSEYAINSLMIMMAFSTYPPFNIQKKTMIVPRAQERKAKKIRETSKAGRQNVEITTR